MAKKERGPVFVDLFAGCGGLSLGLELAGWHPIFVNELNKDAMATYLQNRTRVEPLLAKYHRNDIKDIVGNDGALLNDMASGFKKDYGVDIAEGQLDLVVGGPPCQGFSGIGHRRSFSVHKKQLPSNYLYEDMAYVVSRLRPKMFLFENVRGLLAAKWDSSGTKGEIWSEILATFRGIEEYDVRWSLVYAKDYGVPQNRPRVLMVGIRKDLNIPLAPEPEDAVKAGFLPKGKGDYANLDDLLGDLLDKKGYRNGGVTSTYPSDPKTETQKYFRHSSLHGSLTKKGDPVTEHEYSKHSDAIVRKFQHMLDSGGEIPESMQTKKFAQRVLPKKWGDSGPSITATSLADDYVHFEQPRTLTVREWARLQMFPDWYNFAGKRTTGGVRRAGNPLAGNFDREVPKYTQIGNAVPVGLAREVGKHFLKVLKSSTKAR